MLSDVWIIKHLTSRIMILTLISWMVRSGCCLIPTRDIVTLAVSVLQCNQKVYPEKIKPIQVPWYFLWIFLVKKEVGSMSHLSNRTLRNYKNAFCLYLLMVDVFLELSRFFDYPVNVDTLTSGSSAFSKSSLNIFNSSYTVEAWLEEFWALLY